MRSASLAVAVLVAACTANDDIHAPQIGSVSPARAAPGTQVTIDGSYFCAQPEPEDGEEVDPLACEHVGAVLFDTVSVAGSAYTDTRILVDVPTVEAGPVAIRVSVAGRVSNTATMTVE